MPCNCYFIDLSDFSPEIPMPDDIDDKRLAGPIYDTQETYIRPLLCDDLYEEICSQIDAGTLTAANQTLLDDYIKPVHKRYAFADFLLRHPFTVTKESIVRKSADESEFVDVDNISKLATMHRSYGQTFAAKLTQFLEDNQADYPLYNCDCEDTDGSNFINFF